MTNISKEEILEKHLPYEIYMLRQTYRKLAEGQPQDEVVGNALIESFCIHARSLLDFFESRPNKKDDDYVATDFTSAFVLRINRSAPFETLRTKLNKEIFHLTRGRKNSEADQFNMSTDGKQLVHEIEQEIHRFDVCLAAKAVFNATPRRSPIRKPTHSKVR
jgi:hypothetical protein